MQSNTKITDISRDIFVCIVEWLDLVDALSLCSSLRVSTSFAYQFAVPPRPNFIVETLDGYDNNGVLDWYYRITDYEFHKNNFKFLFKNKRLQVQNSLIERFRLALVLNCLDQIREFLKDDRITTLNDHFVYGSNNKDIVKLFLADPRFDPTDINLIIEAVRWGRLSALELLLFDPRVDPSKGNNQAFRNAVDSGNLSIVKTLLKHPNVDPRDAENHALISAAERGYVDILKLLLADPRIDPSAEGNEAIICASARGHLDIIELLLADSRVNPASRRNRALNRALENMHQDVVQRLLADPRVLIKGNKPSRLKL